MLTDPPYLRVDPGTRLVLAVISDGADPRPKRLQAGVYQIPHFSMDRYLGRDWESWPDLDYEDGSAHNAFGVCDSVEQFLRHPIGQLVQESGRRFCVSFTQICRDRQPEEGGWRWHKWGPYIGEQGPKHEYLHDDQHIEEVWCYHVYEAPGS